MSTLELILAYLRERLRLRVFVPLSVLLALTGQWLDASAAFDLPAFFISAVEALLFCLAFRVWDDLEDRAADYDRHPHRVMVASRRTGPFAILGVSLGVTGVVGLLQTNDVVPRLVALAIAAGTLSIWYASRPSENWNRVAGGLIVLLKYPLIAYAVAPTLPFEPLPTRAIALLIGVYALVCLYEYADDPELRHSLSSRRSLP